MRPVDPRLSGDAPTDFLEQQAVDQRHRIHNSIDGLRTQVRTRMHEKLDVRHHAREHVWPAAGIGAFLSFVIGYGTAGVIKHAFR